MAGRLRFIQRAHWPKVLALREARRWNRVCLIVTTCKPGIFGAVWCGAVLCGMAASLRVVAQSLSLFHVKHDPDLSASGLGDPRF